MKDLIGSVFKGAEVVDKLTESGVERQKTLTDRHNADMTSDNWLSKSIRPLSLLILLVLQIFVVVWSAYGKHVDPVIVGELGILLSSAFGFYFNSKKAERLASQNAKANIEIKKLEAKESIKQGRKVARKERRAERRAERRQDKE